MLLLVSNIFIFKWSIRYKGWEC